MGDEVGGSGGCGGGLAKGEGEGGVAGGTEEGGGGGEAHFSLGGVGVV